MRVAREKLDPRSEGLARYQGLRAVYGSLTNQRCAMTGFKSGIQCGWRGERERERARMKAVSINRVERKGKFHSFHHIPEEQKVCVCDQSKCKKKKENQPLKVQ